MDDWHGYDEEDDDDPDQTHFPAPDKSYYSVKSACRNDAHPEELYSDFNFFDPDSDVPKDEDFDDPFSVLPPELLRTSNRRIRYDEPFVKAMNEEERSRGLMFSKIP